VYLPLFITLPERVSLVCYGLAGFCEVALLFNEQTSESVVRMHLLVFRAERDWVRISPEEMKAIKSTTSY
jgi:hypothetical protein